jgi:queuine/archaeosine tRNA-ribosyltransferase
MDIQWALGADIAMAFDHVVPAKSDFASAEEGWNGRSVGWIDAVADTRSSWPVVRPPPRPSGPSSKAAPTPT